MPPFNSIVQELLLNILGWLGENESSKRSSRVKMAIVKKERVHIPTKETNGEKKDFQNKLLIEFWNFIFKIKVSGKLQTRFLSMIKIIMPEKFQKVLSINY